MTKPGNFDAAITKRITKQGLESCLILELRGELIEIEYLRVTFAFLFEPHDTFTKLFYTVPSATNFLLELTTFLCMSKFLCFEETK